MNNPRDSEELAFWREAYISVMKSTIWETGTDPAYLAKHANELANQALEHYRKASYEIGEYNSWG